MRELAQELHSTAFDWSRRLMEYTEDDASRRRGPDAWSRKEILGHLIDSASNNHQRFVRCGLAEYVEFPEYEQESWVRSQGYAEEQWQVLIGLWNLYNLHIAHVLARLPDSALQHRCKIGPKDPLTLEFIAKDYLRHMRHHLDQISQG
jgi:hypothetical protein